MTDDLTTSYARAYNTRVGFGVRPALILIDFCQGYCDPACDLYAGVEDALASALRVRTAARAYLASPEYKARAGAAVVEMRLLID